MVDFPSSVEALSKIVRKSCCRITKLTTLHLEKVQLRFTEMLPGLEDFSYKETLDKLGLFFLDR